MVVPRAGKNPVLAHLFLEHMLDEKNALENFGYIGYQPPQNALDTDEAGRGRLPAREPRHRGRPRGVVRRGYRLLELPAATDAAWHQVWQQFKAGGVTAPPLAEVEAPATGAVAPHRRAAVALAAARAAGHRLAGAVLRRAALRRAGDRLRRRRPGLPHADPGLEPAGVGLRPVHLRAHHIVGQDGYLRPGPVPDGRLRR